MKPKATAPTQDTRTTRWPFLVGAVFLAVSWALAQWPPVSHDPAVDVEDISAGFSFLVSGALPWVLQWAGVVALLLGVQSRLRGFPKQWILKGALVPLIFGLIWWGWLVARYWRDDPLETVLDMLMLDASRQLGGGPFGPAVMLDMFGPMTAPLLLHGPISLAGWSFLWTGLSTAVVAVIWIAVARIVDRLGKHGRLSGREWLACLLLVHLWLLPVIVVAVARVVAAF